MCCGRQFDSVHHPPGPGRDWTRQETDQVFNRLNRRFDQLISFAFGFTHDLDLAMDAVQNAFVAAFVFLPSFDPGRYRGSNCPFWNWIYMILAREAKHLARAEKLRLALPSATVVPVKRPPRPNREEMLRHPRARACLARLKPRERQILQLCYGSNLDQNNPRDWAAREAGCSADALRGRLFRAFRNLKILLRKEKSCA